MSQLPRTANDAIVQTGSLHGVLTHNIGLSAASAASQALGDNTQLIRIVATEPCFLRMGLTGDTAVVTDLPIIAGIPEYFGVVPGQFLHAITAGGTGTLTISEV